MTRFAAVVLAAITLVVGGCKKQEEAPSPIKGIVDQFEATRKVGMNEYGLSTVQSDRQKIGNIDCLVFNEAAKKPIPTTLGGLSAFADSLYLRVEIGCAPTQEGLVQYETARRLLNQMWTAQISALPYTSQSLLKSSPLGNLVSKRIETVTSEHTVCLSLEGLRAQQEKNSLDLLQIQQNCDRHTEARTTEAQCFNALSTVTAHAYAQGPRDTLAWAAELASRWRATFNVCTPTAAQEYMQFHSTVPRELFNGVGYRFAIPIDPVLQCSIQTIVTKRSNRTPYSPPREWAECGAKVTPYGNLYLNDQPPESFTVPILTDRDKRHWMYDPSLASINPQVWNFGECEKSTIAAMRQQGLNITSPDSIKRYCVVALRKAQRMKQKNL